MTGFAIFLVVVGHVVAREQPAGNAWYAVLKSGIYEFHMPLFMAMSGLVFRYTYTPVTDVSGYLDWAGKKIVRLAPGFFLIGFAILLGKAVGGAFLHVDNAQGSFLQNVVTLFLEPTRSAASSLWYIYVLLEFYLLFPLLLALFRGNGIAVLGLAAVMHGAWLIYFFELPNLLAFKALCEFGLYFWIGALICDRYEAVSAFVARYAVLFGLAFVASFAAQWALPWPFHKTVVGLLSIPAALAWIGPARGRFGAWCLAVSGYTFVIYLLNTIAIGVVKGVMLKFVSWDGPNFLLFFVVLTVVGMGAPILAHRWVFSRHPVLARIMN